MEEYDTLLDQATGHPSWSMNYPESGSVAANLLDRAALMALVADCVTDPSGLAIRNDLKGFHDAIVMVAEGGGGFRLDGWWAEADEKYRFYFRLDKDIPFSVYFRAVAGDVWDWQINHWEV
jgi:hypothetical protein